MPIYYILLSREIIKITVSYASSIVKTESTIKQKACKTRLYAIMENNLSFIYM